MKTKTKTQKQHQTRKENKNMKKKTHKNRSSCVYNDKDFNSNDGMLTTVWGPAMWHYLHTMSFNYPVNPTRKDKMHYKGFILNLQNVLPCGKCRQNLKKNLKKLPLEHRHMESRETFSKYVYDLHETINTMLDKKSGLSYEDVRERYEHFRARCAYSAAEIEKMVATAKEMTSSGEKEKGEKEKGCTEPLYGEKSKCVIHIVPQTDKTETFQIDEKCIKHKMSLA